MANSAPLIWDTDAQKTFETGVDKGVLWVMNNGTYGEGVAWSGLTGVTSSPSGADKTDLWADNIKYISMRAAEDYGFTIKAYASPAEFDECDGSASLGAGKMIVTMQTRKTFAFSWRTKKGSGTDVAAEGYLIHIAYGCTCSPTEKDYQTVNDSPDAIEFSWECSTTPVAVTGYKPTAHIIIDSTKFTTEQDKTKLAALEAIIYGSTTANSTCPTPDSIMTTLGITAVSG